MVSPNVNIRDIGSLASTFGLNLRDCAVLIESSESSEVSAGDRRSKLGGD